MAQAERDVQASERDVFYVESTVAWRRLADRHLDDDGASGALACALYTLVDAYEHARSETKAGRRQP